MHQSYTIGCRVSLIHQIPRSTENIKELSVSTSPSPIFPASLKRHEVDPIFDVSSTYPTFPTANIALTSRLAKHRKFRFDIYYKLEIGGDERSKFPNIYINVSWLSSPCRCILLDMLSDGFDGFWSKEYWQNWKGRKTKKITKLQTIRSQNSKLHNTNNGGKFTLSQEEFIQ